MSIKETAAWLCLGGFLALLAYEAGRTLVMILSPLG